MIEMGKLKTEWGYAPPRAQFGSVYPPKTGSTGPTGGNTSITQPQTYGAQGAGTATAAAGTPTVQAYQQPAEAPAAGTTSNDPFGGELWTPEQWGQVGDYAQAGMATPFQQSEGVTKGMSGLDEMMGAQGWGTGIDEYRAATDPLFALQQKRIADQVKQSALMGGFNDSTMMTDRMTQRLSENMMGREADFAQRALALEEERKRRMMQGLGMYGQFGQQQAGEYGDWAQRGMQYAGMNQGVGDRYWNAPFEFSDASGRQAQGWAGTEMSDAERMYNDYFNVGPGTPQQYTPGFGTKAADFLGNASVFAGGGGFDDLFGGGAPSAAPSYGAGFTAPQFSLAPPPNPGGFSLAPPQTNPWNFSLAGGRR